MSGKHTARRVSRGGVAAAVAGLSALALGGGVAFASTPAPDPAPADCSALASALITAQTSDQTDSKAVSDAQKANAAAVAKLEAIAKVYYPARDQVVTDRKAVATAQAAYDAELATVSGHAGKTSPAGVALTTAQTTLKNDEATVKTLGQQYFDASTAIYGPDGTQAKLAAARATERKTLGVVANIKIDLLKSCRLAPSTTTTPPASVVIESPTTVTQAPAPEVVQDTHLPVTH